LEATHIWEIRAGIRGWATGTKAAAIGISGASSNKSTSVCYGKLQKILKCSTIIGFHGIYTTSSSWLMGRECTLFVIVYD
jgi:hypothetical protein